MKRRPCVNLLKCEQQQHSTLVDPGPSPPIIEVPKYGKAYFLFSWITSPTALWILDFGKSKKDHKFQQMLAGRNKMFHMLFS